MIPGDPKWTCGVMLDFAELAAEEFVEFPGIEDGNGPARHTHQALVAELREGAGKRLAHGAKFGRKNALGAVEVDARRRVGERLRAALEEPVRETALDVF